MMLNGLNPKCSLSADDSLQKPRFNLQRETNIGTWNVISLNIARKLKVVKDEVNRLSINELGISETKWR